MKGTILIVDDDAAMGALLLRSLEAEGYACALHTTAADALAALPALDPDVVLTDYQLGGPSGVDLCHEVAARSTGVPVIVITAYGQLDTAVAAMRAGAYDFLTKPFELEVLTPAIARAVEHRRLRAEVTRLRRESASASGWGELLGESEPMRRLRRTIDAVAASDITVLITGESGTGKERVARELHRRSPRRDGELVAINCAALPEPLLESELFGHTRGAFTGADSERVGLFVRAHGGTLFLDEIGDAPLGVQAKLLRALQERTVRPVGARREVRCDVRVIAATNRDLESAIADRRFRHDLYHRLNVVGIEVPPLRLRRGDVLLLAQHFLARAATRAGRAVTGWSTGAAERLVAYDWPGNVRELENCVERAVLVAAHDQIVVEDLPERVREHRPSHVLVVGETPDELPSMEEVERRYIARVLAATRFNKSHAARILGFDRKTLYAKLARHRLDDE